LTHREKPVTNFVSFTPNLYRYSTDRLDEAVVEFNKAVELQPGYVTAWNNLGDALEQKKDPKVGAVQVASS
jgi:hypothetical protein